MPVKTKTRTNLTVRVSDAERDLLTKLQAHFKCENDAQTVRKLIRDTANELKL